MDAVVHVFEKRNLKPRIATAMIGLFVCAAGSAVSAQSGSPATIKVYTSLQKELLANYEAGAYAKAGSLPLR